MLTWLQILNPEGCSGLEAVLASAGMRLETLFLTGCTTGGIAGVGGCAAPACYRYGFRGDHRLIQEHE